MFRYCIFLIVAGFAASQVAIYVSEHASESGAVQDQPSTVKVSKPVEASPPRKTTSEPAFGRSIRIKADDRGHFVTTARMNGRKVEVLVDTGATAVAINRTTARRLGIHLSESDFKYKVNTANGIIKAARATIKRIELGRVEVRDVQAMVISDKSLGGTLLGMSFLNELKQFQVRNGELLLLQ